MRVVIVEDERRPRERLRRLLTATPSVEVVGEAADGVTALDVIPRLAPDAVFLDVQMPGMSGFDVLLALPERRRPVVVFVTAHDAYALRAFDVSAVDYVLKPVTAATVARAVARVHDRDTAGRLNALLTHLEHTPLHRIVGRHQQVLHVLNVEDIEAFVAESELVFAVTKHGRFLVDLTLRTLQSRLEGQGFIRVHKATLVNVGALAVIDPITGSGATVRLRSGHTLVVSRRFAPLLRARLGW